MTKYIALIHKESGSEYGVSFPDFPGCVTAGKDLDEAAAMAADALAGHIEVMHEAGDVIPAPRALSDVLAHEFADGHVAVMVVDAPSDKTVRFNLTASESDLAAIDRYAEANGLTRSGFMIAASIRAAHKHSKDGTLGLFERITERVRKSVETFDDDIREGSVKTRYVEKISPGVLKRTRKKTSNQSDSLKHSTKNK